jgi:hypothetical protein
MVSDPFAFAKTENVSGPDLAGRRKVIELSAATQT